MKESLFQEFEEVSAKQWKQKIQFDLKGADYNETLVTKTLDGVDIKPFYHPDDTKINSTPPSPTKWNICEKIYVANAEKANKKAHLALENGAECVWFVISTESIAPEELLLDLDLKNTPIYLSFKFLSEDFLQRLRTAVKSENNQIYLQTDIIGKLARTGNWFHNLKEDHAILDKFLENSESFKSVISVNTTVYQNAGANIPQQLAYALAHVNEYLNHITQGVVSNKVNTTKFLPQFLIATGSNYFFEIAKIKALRWLYASLAKEYNLPEACHIIAQPTKRNKTLYDYNVNLLRTTTESMSAILGGADAINNLPYDAIYHKNNEFGDRIARNQLLVMKNESYLEKVSNPSDGAYYIEDLVRKLAEKALEIFKDIEKGGGFLKEIKEGVIQRKIKESAAKEQAQFDVGDLVLIGTNKFQNLEDRMENELELYPFLKKNPRKTLIAPILERRLSENLEKERLESEKSLKTSEA